MVVKLGDHVVDVIIKSYRVSNLLILTCVAFYVEFCLFKKLQVAFFAFLA
jgi:hypothetical protein